MAKNWASQLKAVASPQLYASRESGLPSNMMAANRRNFIGVKPASRQRKSSGATGKNVSGTSDLAPIDQQEDMMVDRFTDAKTVGIL